MIVLGVISVLIALTAVAVAGFSLKRSGDALDETRRAPVRAAQHALLPVIKQCARRNRKLLADNANYQVQAEPLDGAALRTTAAMLRSNTKRMINRTIVDQPLEGAVQGFAESILGGSSGSVDSDAGLITSFDQYALLAEETTEAGRRPGDASGTRSELVQLGQRRGELQRPLRKLIHESLVALDQVDKRIDQVEREGFGDFGKRNPK